MIALSASFPMQSPIAFAERKDFWFEKMMFRQEKPNQTF